MIDLPSVKSVSKSSISNRCDEAEGHKTKTVKIDQIKFFETTCESLKLLLFDPAINHILNK